MTALAWDEAQLRAELPDGGTPLAAIESALRSRGAHRIPHAVGDFREHLRATMRILRGFGEPARVCRAGLLHSAYGTAVNDHALFGAHERDAVRALLGEDAERIVAVFCTLARRGLLTALREAARAGAGEVAVDNWRTGQRMGLPAALVADVVMVDIANIAEQSHRELQPAPWVATCSTLWELVARLRGVAPPPWCTPMDEGAEFRACELYAGALQDWDDPDVAEQRLLAAGSCNPLVGEPRLLASLLAHRRGERRLAATRAQAGLARLRPWGTAWDKRASFERWVAFGETLLHGQSEPPLPIAVPS